MEKKYNALRLHETDNVAVALENLKTGEKLVVQGLDTEIILQINIPYGHKVAVSTILQDQKILKYGECMGIATEDIPAGNHVHVSNVRGLNEEDKTAVFLKGGVVG
ncbi:UxaA family hydrolase [Planococcus halocryophilus]|uniref:SAF domain-containing protein n=1 Tax=Planococcus halocryophilus TaxID=1215089 RepID=A0A1C7DTF4_9BACL|nr:UxaA family hydrolase [Planococcus halocryophilus]ANU14551.1 hypothetical protein BBI08_11990 [Planococcus halocryophilus]